MTTKATVADFSPRMAELEDSRKMVRALMSGTKAMRAAGKTYLPQHPAESDAVYKTRLEKTWLDNFTELAINKAVGKIFSKSVKIADLPTEIEVLCENIDRQGRDIDSFMMDVAKQAFQDGISYVLADKPAVTGELTVAEAKAKGVVPYAIHLKPSALLEVMSEMVNGVATITRIRFMECDTEADGEWGATETPQVRVLRRVVTKDDKGEDKVTILWEVHRQDPKDKEWKLWKEGTTAFKQIYLVPFYTNRCGFMEGRPGFQSIAERNVEHWQWKSEHAHSLSMCCFGMYTATGVDDNFEFTVGPAKTQKSSDPDAKFGVLETSGVGVTLAADTLKAIESRIETAGVNLRVENQGKVTATAAAIDSADTHAGLAAVAKGFGDAVEQLFGYFAEMMGIEAGDASAEFNTDFSSKPGSDAGLQELGKLRAAGDLSREAILKEYQRRGELDEEFDIAADKQLIDNEGPALGTITGQQP